MSQEQKDNPNQVKKISVFHETSSRLLTDESFFNSFDEASAINIINSHFNSLNDDVARHLIKNINGSEEEKLKRFKNLIRSEIYFTAMHNIETLIYLTLSIYKDEPILISMLNARKANEYVKDILDAKFEKLSGGKALDRKSFYSFALLGGCRFEAPEVDDLIETSAELFEFCCRIYEISSEAYNSYKHGMRLTIGESRFELADASVENPEYHTILASHESIQYFRRSKINDDKLHKYYDLETLFFDLDTTVKLVGLIYTLFVNIRVPRIAKSRKEAGSEVGKVNLRNLSKASVQEIIDQGHKFGTMSLDVGRV